MAYVGTPRYLGSDIDTLASILQGEAGGEGQTGLQAVANVIANRAAKNFSGYGSSPILQALAPNQFQGQSNHPSSIARQMAESLLGGKLNDLTGGALYYANPGASTAKWARNLNGSNALQIGHHFFTNNTSGQPFGGGDSGDGRHDQTTYTNLDGSPVVYPPAGKIGGDSMVSRNFDPAVAAANTQTPPPAQPNPSTVFPKAPSNSMLAHLFHGDLGGAKAALGGGSGIGSLLSAATSQQPVQPLQLTPMAPNQGGSLSDYLNQYLQSRMS